MAKNKFKLKVLKDNLKLETKLCRAGLSKAKREGRWIECIEYQEQLSTVNWVLSQIDSIERTGKTL